MTHNPNYKRKSVEQQIFDKVAKHRYKQGARAMASYNKMSEGCAYRGTANTCCAIGCLISDRNYNPVYEGRGAGEERVVQSVRRTLRRKITDRAVKLMCDLQGVHDHGREGFRNSGTRDELFDVAQRYNLNTKVLDRVYKDVA